MAYLGSTSFDKNKRWLLTGQEDEPQTGGRTQLEGEYDLSGDVRGPGVESSGDIEQRQQRRTGSSLFTAPQAFSSTPRTSVRPQPSPSAQSQTQVPSTSPAPALKRAPSLPSYQRTGSLTERLFSPVTQGAQGGQESLSSAADLFRTEAGPSRTYESVGGQSTLQRAYQQGRQDDMEAARGLVGARYEGPQGLDQETTAGLQKLTDDLRTRQQALSSAGGLQTLIGQSVGGLTPGEALFEAKRQLPESRVQARDLGFEQINPLANRLAEERQAAQDFAAQRAAEEADIAEQSRGYLEGERGGISSDIQALIDQRAAQQAAAELAMAGLTEGEDPNRLAAIEAAAPYLRTGTVEDPGDIVGAEAAGLFNTQAMQDKAAADALFAEIMADPRYAAISGYDPLELGVSSRGKHFYDVAGEDGNQDVRQVVEDKALRQLLYDRQRELEAAFDPARGQQRAFSRTPFEESQFANLKPLYHGEDFQTLDPATYMAFDPGVRPSRDNSSSAVQREQFNRINDLLGELDRISEAGEPFRAAQIFADADRYLADEEAALEARGEELTGAAKEWAGMVKKLRGKYRKKKRAAEYGKIGAVIGTILLGDPVLGQRAGASFA